LRSSLQILRARATWKARSMGQTVWPNHLQSHQPAPSSSVYGTSGQLTVLAGAAASSTCRAARAPRSSTSRVRWPSFVGSPLCQTRQGSQRGRMDEGRFSTWRSRDNAIGSYTSGFTVRPLSAPGWIFDNCRAFHQRSAGWTDCGFSPNAAPFLSAAVLSSRATGRGPHGGGASRADLYRRPESGWAE
jgi:hypothetical protein